MNSISFTECLLFNVFLIGILLNSCGSDYKQIEIIPEDNQYSFSVFGDSRDGNAIYSLLQRNSVISGNPEFTVHLGDMISSPDSVDQWPFFIALTNTYLPVDSSFYPVIGNHDVEDANSFRLFLAAFSKLEKTGYYAKILRDCFCVFLNSEDLEIEPGVIGPAQLLWLKEQLSSKAAKDAKFRIIFVHRPPFPKNHHRDKPLQPSDELHNLFQEYNVQIVASGHEHSYNRSEKDDVIYIITGGAGSPLYPDANPEDAFFHYVKVFYLGNTLQIRSIDISGRIRDDFKINL